MNEHCTTKEECIEKVKAIQKYHQDVKKNKDVAYNFLIGEDGNVYEGRGYTTRGGHLPDYTYYYNEKGTVYILGQQDLSYS